MTVEFLRKEVTMLTPTVSMPITGDNRKEGPQVRADLFCEREQIYFSVGAALLYDVLLICGFCNFLIINSHTNSHANKMCFVVYVFDLKRDHRVRCVFRTLGSERSNLYIPFTNRLQESILISILIKKIIKFLKFFFFNKE